MRFVVVGVGLAFAPLDAQDFYSDSLYVRGQRLYFLAVQSERYLSLAEATFTQLVRKYGPEDPLMMYLYGLTALKARYALNPLKKRDYLYEAIAKMDATVARAPNDVEVRFLRGSFYYYLPFFLGKKAEAQADIQALVRLLLAAPSVYRERYQPEVLRAIVGFLQETGWVSAEELRQLRAAYSV